MDRHGRLSARRGRNGRARCVMEMRGVAGLDGRGSERSVRDRTGVVRHGRSGSERHGVAGQGSVRQVRLGWLGQARQEWQVCHGPMRFGEARSGKAGTDRHGRLGSARSGATGTKWRVWDRKARCGQVRQARRGTDGNGRECRGWFGRRGTDGRGLVWHGLVWRGRRGEERHVRASRSMERKGRISLVGLGKAWLEWRGRSVKAGLGKVRLGAVRQARKGVFRLGLSR